MAIAPGLVIVLALIAAVCLWQFATGLVRVRRARDNPNDERAQALGRIGRLQALIGGVALAVNLLLNLPLIAVLL